MVARFDVLASRISISSKDRMNVDPACDTTRRAMGSPHPQRAAGVQLRLRDPGRLRDPHRLGLRDNPGAAANARV